ncbi:L-rhamnose/proton symporter RhaT [Echinicola shivajiensis]|uniref:L-rhamnose/proton symporter RhaT n=1 Tax=Echinicola shivajiensis TaxID=1035916 RepID=UPI001BFC0B7B|nr:L-rhamnose/proton symporter RhaT [Echinicola shivajiensis]
MNPFLGVMFHALGGVAAGSFYLPYKVLKKWPWEVYWLFGGIFAWLIVPLCVVFFVYGEPMKLLDLIVLEQLKWPYVFGVLWGIGGLSFGLSMRYLGIALGMAVTLGLTAIFGTLIPVFMDGSFLQLGETLAGQVSLSGVFLGVLGTFLIGKAGKLKERELESREKSGPLEEFNYQKGISVAAISGLLSACFALGIASGKEITLATEHMASSPLLSNSALFFVIMAGGLTSNIAWCGYQIKKRRSIDIIRKVGKFQSFSNMLLCISAGTIWYFQFFFYGMGSTQMGQLDFASWSLHMSFIILVSNIWGWVIGEWNGTSQKTKVTIIAGVIILMVSTVVIGYGNYLN